MRRKMYNQDGRSMIEMLGVLAIVGVLSVAGISGYTKAMNEYRTNKVIADYASILNSVLELGSSIHKIAPNATNADRYYFGEIIAQLGWLPAGWTQGGNVLFDNYFHRYLAIYYDGSALFFNVWLTRAATKSKIKPEDIRFCQRIVNDFSKKYYDTMYSVIMYENGAGSNGGDINTTLGYGKEYCGGERKCFISQTPDEILKFCQGCIWEKNNCRIRIRFRL